MSHTFGVDPPLPLQVLECDGGMYSQQYNVDNILKDDSSVYSTAPPRKEDVNILLWAGSTGVAPRPFTLTSFRASAPARGFTNPVGHLVVFASWERPSVSSVAAWRDIRSEADFRAMAAAQAAAYPPNSTCPNPPSTTAPTSLSNQSRQYNNDVGRTQAGNSWMMSHSGVSHACSQDSPTTTSQAAEHGLSTGLTPCIQSDSSAHSSPVAGSPQSGSQDCPVSADPALGAITRGAGIQRVMQLPDSPAHSAMNNGARIEHANGRSSSNSSGQDTEHGPQTNAVGPQPGTLTSRTADPSITCPATAQAISLHPHTSSTSDNQTTSHSPSHTTRPSHHVTPVAFMDLGVGGAVCSAQLPGPVCARYLLVKLLRSSCRYGEGLDVERVVPRGHMGPPRFASGALV